MHSQVEARACWSPVPTSHRAPIKVIQLDGSQARQWLEYLADLSPRSQHAEVLTEFRSQLEDALWLARWKREYVVIELELAAVPGLIVALSSDELSAMDGRSCEIQAHILATLA